jgi:hypothetical protein
MCATSLHAEVEVVVVENMTTNTPHESTVEKKWTTVTGMQNESSRSKGRRAGEKKIAARQERKERNAEEGQREGR